MTLAKTYPIRLVCRLLGVPRSSLYYTARPAPCAEAMFKTALLDLAGEWPTYGYRRRAAAVVAISWETGLRLMRANRPLASVSAWLLDLWTKVRCGAMATGRLSTRPQRVNSTLYSC